MADTNRVPRNTSKAMQEDAEKLLFLAAGMADGSPTRFIEDQEAAGQREIVASTVIPTRIIGAEEELTALGFTLGDVVEGDPLFRHATLPEGWKREGSDHAMWSKIVDSLGRPRCSIFYKAAFYDRDAHISVYAVGGYVSECLYEDKVPVLDQEWATREAVLAAVQKASDQQSEQASQWDEWGNTDYAREAREKVAKCAELRARLEQGGDA
jgi:hypothetical protein